MVFPKILVVYKDNECEKDLAMFYSSIKALIGDKTPNSTIDEEIKDGAEYDIHISTKYYDADVQMVFHKYQLEDYEAIIKSVECINAIIFYFKTSEKLDDYMMFVIEMLNNTSAEVNILVHDSPDHFLSREHENGINQLCADFYMELVQINGKSEVEQKSEDVGGFLGEGKEGIDRIVESLQCNMWSSMIRKAAGVTAQSNQIKEENNMQDHKENEEEIKEVDDIEEDANENNNNEIDNADDANKIVGQKVILEDKSNSLFQIPDYSNTEPTPNAEEIEREEKKLEELGSLMSQIRNLKANIDNNMSLEERRKNAEDMILKIAKFMNLDEDEVDFSDEEENHEEN